MGWLKLEIEEGRLPRSYGDQRTRRRMAEACLDHHRARGNRAHIVDWTAAIRNWFRIAAERDGFQPAQRKSWRPENPEAMTPEALRVIQGGKP